MNGKRFFNIGLKNRFLDLWLLSMSILQLKNIYSYIPPSWKGLKNRWMQWQGVASSHNNLLAIMDVDSLWNVAINLAAHKVVVYIKYSKKLQII